MRIILLILFIASQAWGQAFYLKNDQNIDYASGKFAYAIKFYVANINNIGTVNGQTIINIPVRRVYKKDCKSIFVDGYLAQYEKQGDDVTLLDIETYYIEFDFEKGKYTELDKPKIKQNDDGMFDKPDKEKIKSKIKNKDKKP